MFYNGSNRVVVPPPPPSLFPPLLDNSSSDYKTGGLWSTHFLLLGTLPSEIQGSV